MTRRIERPGRRLVGVVDVIADVLQLHAVAEAAEEGGSEGTLLIVAVRNPDRDEIPSCSRGGDQSASAGEAGSLPGVPARERAERVIARAVPRQELAGRNGSPYSCRDTNDGP